MKLRRLHTESQTNVVSLVDEVRRVALPLSNPNDLDPLIDRIGDARYVLLGEASHGTSEYYRWRAQISERLIREKGFSFIAVEGDWPDCYRVNRYVKGFEDAGRDAREVLEGFLRWPTWMWANQEVERLAEWLRAHNRRCPQDERVGFYGLDVYSLWDSLYAVLRYLRKTDPGLLPAAQRALVCFEPFGEDVQQYARATALVPTSCEDEVIDLLRALHSKRRQWADGREEFFTAEQNALVVKNAEAYHRAMVRGGPESWNVRDRHMADTLERLMRHHGPQAGCIVWAHNTHIGDARYTDMADEGMVNIGQLVREAHTRDGVFLVGFSSHSGSVVAARDWEAPMEKMFMPTARRGSWEDVLHRASPDNKLLLLETVHQVPEFLEVRGHRAIGVVYHPTSEEYGNYVPTVLPNRYDALCYLDASRVVHPLHTHPAWEKMPETYPFGV
jgi:erythromycin esterase-like protein